jgi:UDP-3-O-[3-hydroxymyristoyl] glucosamine N-acyltransferase
MPFTAAEIAAHLGGQVIGDGNIPLTGFAPATSAREGDLTFAENETFFNRAVQSPASAVLVDGAYTSPHKTVIRVTNSRIAYARVLPLFFPEQELAPGIHPTAVVAATAQVDPTAHVGPHCVLGEFVKLGPGVILEGGDHLGAHSAIGEASRLFPNVVLYPRTQIGQRVRIHAGTVIGADGFGYVLDNGVHRKVPQVGNVVILDDVEIGANVTIDRGALGSTTIGRGTKIDNLVQVAHNVTVGDHSLIVAQAGIAGSTKLGNYVTLAGQAGLSGHLKIGNKVMVAAQSGVMHDIKDGERWFGTPAQPDRQMKRQLLAMHQLPDLLRRVSRMEQQLRTPSNQPLKPAPPPGGSENIEATDDQP